MLFLTLYDNICKCGQILIFTIFGVINVIKWPTDGKIKEKEKTIKSNKIEGTI